MGWGGGVSAGPARRAWGPASVVHVIPARGYESPASAVQRRRRHRRLQPRRRRRPSHVGQYQQRRLDVVERLHYATTIQIRQESCQTRGTFVLRVGLDLDGDDHYCQSVIDSVRCPS